MKNLNPPEGTEEGNPVVVYRTGIVYELDMVADAMTRAGIPYFRRRESIGGLSFAMPVMPSMAPGEMYAIVVPETWADRAKHFIAALPVAQGDQASASGFRSSRELTSQWAWALVAGLGLLFILAIVMLLKG